MALALPVWPLSSVPVQLQQRLVSRMVSEMVRYFDRLLEFEDSKIEFPGEINEVIEVDDGYVVQFRTAGIGKSHDEKTDSRNVWKVGHDGSIAWKIERADQIGGEYDPYTGLWREGDEIWAYNFNGLAYHVDTETGELGKTREMK